MGGDVKPEKLLYWLATGKIRLVFAKKWRGIRVGLTS
jgi:hypothetical protein